MRRHDGTSQSDVRCVTRQRPPCRSSLRSGRGSCARRPARRTLATFETLRRLLKDASNQEDNYLYGGAMIVVRDPKLVQRILELGLTDEWPPGSASWYMRNVGYNSGHPGLARDFIVQNFEAVQAKASRAGRPWILPSPTRASTSRKKPMPSLPFNVGSSARKQCRRPSKWRNRSARRLRYANGKRNCCLNCCNHSSSRKLRYPVADNSHREQFDTQNLPQDFPALLAVHDWDQGSSRNAGIVSGMVGCRELEPRTYGSRVRRSTIRDP